MAGHIQEARHVHFESANEFSPKDPPMRSRTAGAKLNSNQLSHRRLQYASSRGNATLDGHNLEEVLLDERQSTPIAINEEILGLYKDLDTDDESTGWFADADDDVISQFTRGA
ncbi:MAG: uncharacterized protein KVP18_002280 [Porospora cf. gigantea A]|uniref:uncharacterized protein n=1 Tax=Porospora cf. gigantea A TaxID=2853593 RepID=UPI0035594C21|nr:MAG: hypothetical protein KVP18_002280 [Porospora cf. gigantea A]